MDGVSQETDVCIYKGVYVCVCVCVCVYSALADSAMLFILCECKTNQSSLFENIFAIFQIYWPESILLEK